MISRQSSLVGTTDEELADVSLFRERVEKLREAQAKYQGIPVSQFARDPGSGEPVFAANTPELDSVINLAVRFRFFYADKEPTQFEKIATKIRRRASDEWAQNYIDRISDWYRTAMKACDTSSRLGHPTPNKRVISLWFNSEFFHSASDKRAELAAIHEAIGEEASLFQLYTAIAKCASFIQMLYVVVHRLEPGHEFIYTPNHHFANTA
jgi:hypothetical protein